MVCQFYFLMLGFSDKQRKRRSDCSRRSSLIWVYAVWSWPFMNIQDIYSRQRTAGSEIASFWPIKACWWGNFLGHKMLAINKGHLKDCSFDANNCQIYFSQFAIKALKLCHGLRPIRLCPWARHFILCLVLVQPRKMGHPDMTEKLLTPGT